MTEKTVSVYFISNGEYIKIGISKDVKARLASLQTSHHRKLKLIGEIKLSSRWLARLYERKFHSFFRGTRKKGEWFHIPYGKRQCKLEGYDPETETIIYGDGGIHLSAIIQSS